MSFENRQALSALRLDKAEEAISDALLLLRMERFNLAANRAYFAVFYAMRAVLALDGIDRKHHSGVIAEFRRLYIKPGIFENWMSDTIGDLFDLRTDTDYDDFFIVSKEEVAEEVRNAERFVTQVEEYLELLRKTE